MLRFANLVGRTSTRVGVNSAIVLLAATLSGQAREPATVIETAKGVDDPAVPAAAKPIVQIALLLDTSSSMNGLIEQAKTQLWQVVNEFVLAKKDGKAPDFLVALYEYGKNSLPAEGGFIRQISPFTDNLDKISEELFRLRTADRSGGDERCGQAIDHAVRTLQWSALREDLKVLFIAGNESFAQGPIDYRIARRTAIEKDIMINTIFCGAHAEGVNLGWHDGARLADGSYASIDQNRSVASIDAPQDGELRQLSEELNHTYIPFGALGDSGVRRQLEQDRNALRAGAEAAAQRAVSKSAQFYKAADWDLVDAIREKKVTLKELSAEQLPPGLRELSLEERAKFIADKSKERETIQQRIQDLQLARRSFVDELAAESIVSAELADATPRAATATPRPGAPLADSRDAAAGEAIPADSARDPAAPARARLAGRNAAPQLGAGGAAGGAASGGATLGQAIGEILRRQAAKKSFELAPKKKRVLREF